MTRLVPLAALAVLLPAGCGPTGQPSLAAPVPVTGKIAYADGKPIGNVQLYFLPVDAPAPAYAATKDDGTFVPNTYESKEGICPGKYVVYLRPIIAAAATQAKSKAALQRVPEAYKDEAGKSPLEVEITSGTTLNLKLGAK